MIRPASLYSPSASTALHRATTKPNRGSGEVRCLIYCAYIYFSKKWGVISTMTSRYRLLLVAVSISCSAALPACYTLLQHPRLSSLNYQRPEDTECVNCHTSEEIWTFNHAPRKPSYEGYAEGWIEYYDVPRWYRRSWGYTPRVGPEVDPHEQSSTPAGDPAVVKAVSSEQSKKKGNASASDQPDKGKRPIAAKDSKKRSKSEKGTDHEH